jgi:hypothetical protein
MNKERGGGNVWIGGAGKWKERSPVKKIQA